MRAPWSGLGLCALSIATVASPGSARAAERPLDIAVLERTELPGGLVRERLRLPGFDPDEAVPGIAVHPGAGGPWPLTFVLHWFQGSKESLEAWCTDLAARGIFALAIDAHLHGERAVAGMFQRENMPDLGVEYSIWVHQTSIARTVEDVAVILDALARRPDVDVSSVAATGMSMGGGTAMALAWREPRIRAVASLVGAVDNWWDVTKIPPGPEQDARKASYGPRLRELVDSIDPFPRAGKIPPKALFLANGCRDASIDIESVRRFVRVLKPLYGSAPDDLRYLEVPDAGHEVTGQMWKAAQDWLAAHLKARDTDWLREARYGVFMHFLPADARGLAQVDAFDVDGLARQVESLGAKYFVITLGQNSGFYISPNATYEKLTGYDPGERCSRRDLPLALHRALEPRGIRLMLYLPAQTPNQDPRAQRAFGLAEGPRDQPMDVEFSRKWAEVIQEWSDRYGTRVAGWWFDGCYEHVRFTEEIGRIYAGAAKHGNPHAVVAFNPGVKVIRWTLCEDFTAGELNEPFDTVPSSRWLEGSQWHALTHLGSSWSRRDTRYPDESWARWVKDVVAHDGVVTLDMGPNWDPRAGPIGSLDEAQMRQVKAVQSTLARSPKTSVPRRLERAESFLGIHFDFHAGPDCTAIGKSTTREMIESVIDQVHPDYIQIDCKGHPGLSSYPTRVGNPAPGFVGDPLRLWRQVTAERGVALFMHYSGVWDSEAIRRHPDWGAVNADGKTNPNATSFFSPYADQLMIPQLRELAGDYGVDGAWIDGECWASVPDFGKAAIEAFRKATGIEDIPRKAGDPHWLEFLEFNREAFRNHLRHYISEVKRTNPEMQLCSNWAFTDHMPEAVSAPVDWISGDYSPEDSVNSARFSARYMARQGKPWDLMAWSFTRGPGKNGSNQKTAVQLQREAAAVLSLGGGFQAYFNQRRDGSVRLELMPVMAEVARFCRARQAICHRSVPVPQVALVYSTAAHYREANGLFPRDLTRIRGTLEALLEGQQSVEVLGEHHLVGRMADYPLIVVPECDYLEPGFRDGLIAYAESGGSLLLVGPTTAAMFRRELGISLEDAPRAEPRYLEHAGGLVATEGQVARVRLESTARAFGSLHDTGDVASPSVPAASIARLGRGRIAATYFCLSQGYVKGRSGTARAFLNDLAHELFPDPIVEVRGSPDVDVAVQRSGGRLAVNLVNTAGPHDDPSSPILESIPPVGPLEITIRTATRPGRVTLEPGGEPLSFEFEGGATRLALPRLDIHVVIVID